MIGNADTIVYPGTMMIKSFHTSITDGAVLGSGSSDYKTIRTKLYRIYELKQF